MITDERGRNTSSVLRASDKIYVGSALTPNRTEIGFTHAGARTSKEIFRIEAENAFWWRCVIRMMLVPWAFLLSTVLGAAVGLELRAGRGAPMPTTWSCTMAATFAFWSAVVGLTSVWYRGLLQGPKHQLLLIVLGSLSAFQLTWMYAARNNDRGVWAAWRLLAEVLDLPFAWYHKTPAPKPGPISLREAAIENSSKDFFAGKFPLWHSPRQKGD